MELVGGAWIALVGAAGGAVAELLHWWNLRTMRSWPLYARHARYWILTVLMIGIAGGVARLYFGDRANAVLTLHIGASTPLLLQKFVTSLPSAGESKVKAAALGTASVRRFFRW
jgi:hypothetical protein